jgi:hypothetical protein
MEILNYNSSNLINDNENNFQEDINIRQLQQNLIMMGFDITMINKIISYFKIRTENEALDYLIKNEEGLWNHPFIPREIIDEANNNNILEQPKKMMSSVLSRIKSKEITSNQIEKKSSIKDNEINEYKIEDNICEICGELKDCHINKEYNINNNNINRNLINNINIFNTNNNLFNTNNNNRNYNLINFNDDNNLIGNNENKKDILIDDEDQKEEKKEEINQKECPICMGEFDNPVEIEKCKHKFCYECFNSYLCNLISNNNIDKIISKNKYNMREVRYISILGISGLIIETFFCGWNWFLAINGNTTLEFWADKTEFYLDGGINNYSFGNWRNNLFYVFGTTNLFKMLFIPSIKKLPFSGLEISRFVDNNFQIEGIN